MRRTHLVSLLLLAFLTPCVDAYEIRSRFVRRVGNVDQPIDQTLYVPSFGHPWPQVRIRVQFGVFDDANGPAPEGGILGWHNGDMHVFMNSGFSASRTPGRLAPFVFALNGNGQPAGNPFTYISGIDATIGLLAPQWPAGSDPDSPPPPPIRGRNEWASVFEITLTPPQQSYADCFVSISGNMFAALEWRTVGTPLPPTETEDGNILYAPIALPSVPFTRQIRIVNDPTPAPGTAGIVLTAVALASRRRRTVSHG